MDCKKCGYQNEDSAEFCVKCGEGIASVKCPRCYVPVKEGAKFCGKCGMPLDGSAVCKTCRSVIKADAEFCIKCGARADGKKTCGECGYVAEAEEAFCLQCGAALAPIKMPAGVGQKANAKSGGAVSSSNQTVNSGLREKIVAYSKMGTAFGLMLLFFIISFFGMVSFKAQVPISQTVIMPINVRVSGADLMAAPFRMISPPTSDEAMQDFEAYLYVNMRSNVSSTGSVKEVERLVNNYGVLKLLITNKITFENAQQTMLSIIFMSMLTWAITIVTLVFSILLLVSGIKQLLGKKPKKLGHQSLGFALVFGLVMIFPFLANIGLGSANYVGLGGSAIAMLVLSILAIGGFASCKYIFEGEKLQIKKLITRGVSLVSAIIITACFAGGAIGITAKNPSDNKYLSTSVSIGETQFGVDQGSDITKIEKDAYIKSCLAYIFEGGSTEQKKQLLKQMLSPQILLSFPTAAGYNVMGDVLEWSLFVLNLLAAATLSALLIMILKDFANASNKKSRLALHVLSVVAAFFAVGLCSALAFTATMATLTYNISYGIGAAIVTGLIFAIGSLVQNIVVNKFARKDKQNIAEPAKTELTQVEA